VLGLKPEIKGNVLNTTQMVLKIFENKERYSKTDLAYSAHAYLARGLATLAIEKALENGVKNVGFSGGVACNQILTSNMQKIVEKAGLKFFVHKAVPPGDGGLSFGQAVVGGFLTI
ncbi:carbamoyltransferase HypF, partial [Candidatus Bathyarchaeota archaeon]